MISLDFFSFLSQLLEPKEIWEELGNSLLQHGPIELSTMKEVFSVCGAQYGSY